MSRIPPNIRFYLLVAGTVVLYFAAYQFAFLETYTVFRDNSKLAAQLKNSDELPQLISKLERAILVLDRKTDKDTLASGSIQQQTIDFVTSFNGNIRLEETSAPVFVDNGDYSSETVKVMLSGSYHDLLQLLYKFEFSNVNGRIISCSFESKEVLADKRKKLFLNLYVQNIKWKRE